MDALFEKIDLYLGGKKPNEANLLIFMVALLIAFIAYTYAFDPASDYFKKSQREFTQTTNKFNVEKSYMDSITVNGDSNFYINKLDREIEQAKIDLERIIYTNGYVDNKLKELSYLLFNDKNWAIFLDQLALLASTNSVDLKSIANEFKEPTLQKIEQILTISLELDGNFVNILRFINAIEESRLVVDIYEMSLKSGYPLEGTIKIAVWGMKY